jgi:hypothetical protein
LLTTCIYTYKYEQWFGITAPVPSYVDAKVLFALMIEKKDIKTTNHPELYQIVAKLCKYDHPMADTVKLESTSIASFRADVLRAGKLLFVHLHKRFIHNDVMQHIV